MYNKSLINTIKNILQKKNHTVAVAESVTSGHLQAAFSLADGATQIFQGGITAYNLGQKARHLKINPIQAEFSNCVSERITQQMALETLKLFSCEWSIAITGYAAPVPEIGIEDLFAFVAIAHNDQIILSKKISADKLNILDCQLFYANQVLQYFSDVLKTRDIRPKAILSEH